MMRVALTEGLCDPAPAFVDSLYLQYMSQRGFPRVCVCVCTLVALMSEETDQCCFCLHH